MSPRVIPLLRTAAVDAQAANAFARLARIAASMLHAPTSFLSVLDAEAPTLLRVRGAFGVPESAGPLRAVRCDEAPCHRVITSAEPLVIEDAHAPPGDPAAPLLDRLEARSYLGVPLITRAGDALGALAVLDRVPHRQCAHELMLLRELSEFAVSELERLDELARRRRAEEALRARERLFRAVFDRASQFMAVCTPDGVLLDANQAALDLLGLVDTEVVGRPFAEAQWWAWCSAQQAAVEGALARAAGGEPVRCSLQYLAAGGERVPLDFTATPVSDDAGLVSFVLVEARHVGSERPAPVRCADPTCAYADVRVTSGVARN